MAGWLGGAGTPGLLTLHRLPEELIPSRSSSGGLSAPLGGSLPPGLQAPGALVPLACSSAGKVSLWCIKASRGGTFVALGTSAGAAVFDIGTGCMRQVLRSQSDVLCQALLPSASALLCGHRNGTLSLVDMRARGHTRVDPYLSAHGLFERTGSKRMAAAVCGMEVLPHDENYVIISHIDGTLYKADLRCAKAALTFTEHRNTHMNLSIAITDQCGDTTLAACGDDAMLRVWSASDGACLKKIAMQDSQIARCVRFGEMGLWQDAGHHHSLPHLWAGTRDTLQLFGYSLPSPMAESIQDPLTTSAQTVSRTVHATVDVELHPTSISVMAPSTGSY